MILRACIISFLQNKFLILRKFLKTIFRDMKQDEKVALVRIMTELVKSDTVICRSEMAVFDEICESYKIDKEEALAKAHSITLAEAVKRLKSVQNDSDEDGKTEMSQIMGILERLSLADGACESSEALLITALRIVLSNDGEGEVDCSCDVLDNIAPFTVFYVESEYDTEINNEIIENYRLIEREFKLAGFEFVYIPKRAESFKAMNKDALKEIIGFLAPTIAQSSKDVVDNVYEEICNLDTVNFAHSLLRNKLGLECLYDTEPSFLVKLGDSRVSFKPVHNYLKFMTKGDVVADVRRFVDSYLSVVKPNKVEVSGVSSCENCFEYSGFNKSIFDLLAFPSKSCASRVFVDEYNLRIVLEDVKETLDVYAYERALYTFLLYAGVEGITIRVTERDKAKKERNNRIFNKIYQKMNDKGDYNGDSWDAVGLKSSISRIKKRIKAISLLENKDDYIPVLDDNGVLSLRVSADKVLVRDSSGKQVLMKDSAAWNKIKE